MRRPSTEFIIVHATGTPADKDVTVRDLDREHRAEGYFGIGYHYVIGRDSFVHAGRSLYEPGAHYQGFNNRSVGVCVVGAPDNFTTKQLKALDHLLDSLTTLFRGAEVMRLFRHSTTE